MKSQMMKKTSFAVLVATVVLFGCQKDFGVNTTSMSATQVVGQSATLQVAITDTTIRGVVNNLIKFPFNGKVLNIYIATRRSLNLWEARGCNPLYARPPIEGRENIYLAKEMGNGQIILAVAKDSQIVIKVDGIKIN